MSDLNVIYRIAADISGLQSGVKRAADATEGLTSMAATVGKALTAAFTVGAILKLGKDVLDFAGTLEDLSAQTGISTTGLQKFDLAFSQAGVTMETVAAASAKLANNLIGGDKSTVAALQQLGLSVKDLKQLAPEDQFLKVADAIGQIANPTERAYAAMQVFGKGGVELLKGLDGHLADTVAQFEKLGLIVDEKTVKAIDDFGDQLGVAGKQLLALGAEVIGPLLPLLGQLLNLLMPIAKVIGETLTFAVKAAYSALLVLGSTIDKLVADIVGAATHIPFLGKHLGIAADAAAWLRADAQKADEALGALWKTTDQTGESAKKATPALIGLGTATEDAAKAAKKAAAAQREFNNWLVMREFEDAAEQAKRFAAATEEAARNQAMLTTWLWNSATPLETQNDLLRAIETNMVRIGAQAGKLAAASGAGVIPGLATQGLEPFKQSFTSKTFAGFGDFLKGNLADTITKAFQGGGDVVKSLGSTVGSWFTRAGGPLASAATKGLTSILGKGLGGALGSLVPGLGALLGPAIEKVAGLFKNLFGGKEKETNKIREEFVQMSGGLDALNQQAARAGVTLTAMLNAKTPEAYRKEIDKINKALEFQDSAMKTLDETVKKYGFTIGELGPAFARQQLDKKAEELYQDFKVLAAAGVPVVNILQKMGPAINEYVQAAKRAGAEVPAAMKPILQQAIDLGLLLDENGIAYTSLEQLGLSFAETMTQGFNRLIATVDRLTQAIARGLGIALDDLPDEVNVDINVNTHYRSDGDQPPSGNGPPVDLEPPKGHPPLIPTPSSLTPSAFVSPTAQTGQFAATALQPPPAGVLPGTDIGRVNVDLTLNIDGVFSEGDLVSTIQRRVVPIITETWNANVAGTRTRARDVLGVA
jgi:hypothetical protein